MLAAFTMAMGGVHAASLLHEALLYNKMRSPQSFFDTTPSGRILNRFSKDINVIDEILAPSILQMLNTVFNSLSTLVVIIITTPLFLVVVLPLALLYIFAQVPEGGQDTLAGCRAGVYCHWVVLGMLFSAFIYHSATPPALFETGSY